jgi:hypothetical protein
MSSDEKPHAGGQAQLFGELNGEDAGKLELERPSCDKRAQSCRVHHIVPAVHIDIWA